jgi:hypothetical protein
MARELGKTLVGPHYQIEHLGNLLHFGLTRRQRLHATLAGPMPERLGAFLLR